MTPQERLKIFFFKFLWKIHHSIQNFMLITNIGSKVAKNRTLMGKPLNLCAGGASCLIEFLSFRHPSWAFHRQKTSQIHSKAYKLTEYQIWDVPKLECPIKIMHLEAQNPWKPYVCFFDFYISPLVSEVTIWKLYYICRFGCSIQWAYFHLKKKYAFLENLVFQPGVFWKIDPGFLKYAVW